MTIKTERPHKTEGLYRKKVGFYTSVRNHYSLLEVVLRSLRPLEAEVTLFAPDELLSRYADGWGVSRRVAVSQTRFLSSEARKQMNSVDFMIFDQPYSFRELAGFSFFKIDVPKLLIVHDCNSWFYPKPPKGLKNSLKYLFTKSIKRRFRVFAVAGSNMKRHLTLTYSLKNIFLIPFRYADFDAATDGKVSYQRGAPIRICIPGTISKRRNYGDLLDHLCIPVLKDKIILNFLGKPEGVYGKQMIDRMKALRTAGYELIFSEEYIDNAIFEESIGEAHLLLSHFDPVYFTNNGQVEIYGRTKETGITVLMLNKAKAGLLPAGFEQMKEIEDQTIYYSDLAALSGIISAIYEKKGMDLNQLLETARENAIRMHISQVTDEIATAYQLVRNGN